MSSLHCFDKDSLCMYKEISSVPHRKEGAVEKQGKTVAAVPPGLLFKANALRTKCLVEWHVFTCSWIVLLVFS